MNIHSFVIFCCKLCFSEKYSFPHRFVKFFLVGLPRCVCVCVFVWWCSRTFASLSWTLTSLNTSNCYLFTSLFFFIFSFSFGLLWLFLQGLEQLSLYPSGNRLCVVTFARQTRSNRHLDISQCFLYFLVASRLKWMHECLSISVKVSQTQVMTIWSGQPLRFCGRALKVNEVNRYFFQM